MSIDIIVYRPTNLTVDCPKSRVLYNALRYKDDHIFGWQEKDDTRIFDSYRVGNRGCNKLCPYYGGIRHDIGLFSRGRFHPFHQKVVKCHCESGVFPAVKTVKKEGEK